MEIPFFNLTTQSISIKQELDSAFAKVMAKGQFIGGDFVSTFEKEFACYNQLKHCVGVANGTDAIELALRALNIGEGDEVIVPALTWISDADAVVATGAKVVFADVLDGEMTIDPQDVKQRITNKTKAIIAVHLYGHACRLEEINEVIKGQGISLIEDCAQAHGTTYKGKKVGQIGIAATYSFYPSKNLGAYGDAGAVTTNNEELANKVRLLANHGQPVHNEHLLRGMNSRLDSMQAAFLSVKLKHLDHWVSKRRELANRYNEGLNAIYKQDGNVLEDSFHLYVIKESRREELADFLKSKGIATAIHYPKSLPETAPYKSEVLPVAKHLAATVLSLPLYPELTNAEQEYIIKQIKSFHST